MTFLLCDAGRWYILKLDVQNRWDDNTHTYTHSNMILEMIKSIIVFTYDGGDLHTLLIDVRATQLQEALED